MKKLPEYRFSYRKPKSNTKRICSKNTRYWYRLIEKQRNEVVNELIEKHRNKVVNELIKNNKLDIKHIINSIYLPKKMLITSTKNVNNDKKS